MREGGRDAELLATVSSTCLGRETVDPGRLHTGEFHAEIQIHGVDAKVGIGTIAISGMVTLWLL